MGCEESKNGAVVEPSSEAVDSIDGPVGRSSRNNSQQARDSGSSLAMPLFRKQSVDAKKRLQYQLYLARESPETTFDISQCEVADIPAGVFSLCKVLHKEVLLAHDNWLSSLKGGGSLRDLIGLRVLDLHNNELVHLPDELGNLQCLQVLNIENNKLKEIPNSIGTLQALQTLKLRGNKIKSIPDALCGLKSLRTVDVSSNHVITLPQQLCQVRTLENLLVDASQMHYPDPEICSQGVRAIMKYLCKECNLAYEPPTRFLLNILEPPTPAVATSPLHSPVKAQMNSVTESFMQYEKLKEMKRQDIVSLEKQLEQEQRLQAALADKAMTRKKHLIEYVAKDQERMQDELSVLQQHKDEERHKMLRTLCEAEKNASDLVKQLLEMNEKARKTEELLEQMDKQRMEADEWFKVRQEEVDNLRKTDVLDAMQKSLAENAAFQQLIDHYQLEKIKVMKKAHETNTDVDGWLDSVLHVKDKEHLHMVGQLLKEEEMQKEAFEMLMMQKDARHQRVSGQIDLIHAELSQLTLLEIEQRDLKIDTQKELLFERRSSLTHLLVQLMDEKDKRELELKARLTEMEQQREDDQLDYWLVQYQRLMDRKPSALIDQEKQLEIAVVQILERAGACEYIPVFARHRMTIETLCVIAEEDLKQMGMYEVGLRKAILLEVDKYKLRTDEERAAAKLKGLDNPEDVWLVKPPSPVEPAPDAPPSAPADPTPTAPSEEVIARGVNSECVVCMDNTSSILFLNCGHVCCCSSCGGTLSECPMCRGEIVQRITLA